jgi:hypothetical protein
MAVLVTTAAGQVSGAPPEEAPPSPDAARDEAVAHFMKGLSLFDSGVYAAALAEFLEARRIYPLRNASLQAGFCLEKLGRFDEALDQFEAVLRDFGETMPADVKVIAQRKVVEMRGLVGTLEIEGAEPGSALVIDGRDRGEFPALAPLRVAAGSHLVRVFKEGFEPFETRVEVAGGQLARVRVILRALTSSGRLRVEEQGGRSLAVVIDGSEVGKAPWEGRLAVGEHVVLLRGEGDLGTQPVSVAVELNKPTLLTLVAEELASRLRIEPVPVNASVAIDAVVVGRGVWEGKLRAGEHAIEVAAPGFVPELVRVALKRGEREVVRAALRRDETSPFWREPPRPPRFVVESSVSVALAPTLGGDVAGTCVQDCERALGAGGVSVLHGGYELGFGLGFGVSIGHLAVVQSMTGRRTSVNPVDLGTPPVFPAGTGVGTADDRLALRGVLAGGWLGYSLAERIALLHFRLGAGALIGDILNERTGRFLGSSGARYDLGPVAERHDARFLYLTPEVRWGLRLSRRVEVNIGVAVPVLIALTTPRWDAEQVHYVRAGEDGFATFAADALVSPVVLMIAPGLGARYDF